MSYRFILGSAGAGKSTYLVNEMTQRAMKEPSRSFLYIVPDQYTMQMQKQMVMANPNKCIMNIDVLSFGRLSHRILENEVDSREILDDTGKNLLVAKIGREHLKELPVIGGKLSRQGYVHEVKSAISEFMQYSIGERELEGMVGFARDNRREALAGKLTDLGTIYRYFLQETGERFVTTEGRLGVLTERILSSDVMKDASIVFDGFTGFTPVQMQVIASILKVARDVAFPITMDKVAAGTLGAYKGEENLFALGHRTVRGIRKLANACGISEESPVVIAPDNLPRFVMAPDIAHIERTLFRPGILAKYDGECKNISVNACKTIRDELSWLSAMIRRMVFREGYLYRDIAVICGNLESYKESIRREFERTQIPCFIDSTYYLNHNACVEMIRSAMRVALADFSYESVFRFLRAGLEVPGISADDIDMLEDIVVEKGINRKYRWKKECLGLAGHDKSEFLEKCRLAVMGALGTLENKSKTVAEHIDALYQFILKVGLEQQLLDISQKAGEVGNHAIETEYRQIYTKIMGLLEQIYNISATETCTLKEFIDVFEAGVSELRVGVIPQGADGVVVGDIERTRLKQVKVLFFIGVNDGSIPRNTNKGGIISDLDRQLLQDVGAATGLDIELAPAPRELMYRQRLYLYINLTKPSEKLYLSYINMDQSGKSILPSYLIKVIEQMYVKLPHNDVSGRDIEDIYQYDDAVDVLAHELSKYALGEVSDETQRPVAAALYEIGLSNEKYKFICDQLIRAAFMRYSGSTLGRELARALYGTSLNGSVTRFQTYAECQYKYFLKYGLELGSRSGAEVSNADMGNMHHKQLEVFQKALIEQGLDWTSLGEEEMEQLLMQAYEELCSQNSYVLENTTGKNRYASLRSKRIVARSVRILAEQLRRGKFVPAGIEEKFRSTLPLNGEGDDSASITLKGVIDRKDICKNGDQTYVKIIDYKSSDKDISLDTLADGTALQLPLYMDYAVSAYGDDAHPAAMLYYAMKDPIIEETESTSTKEGFEEQMLGALKMSGIVNADAGVAELLDEKLSTGKSDLISIKSGKSNLVSEEDFRTITDYAKYKAVQIGRQILGGDITCAPVASGKDRATGKYSACEYCEYANACGFYSKIPGYECKPSKKGCTIDDLKSEMEQ